MNTVKKELHQIADMIEKNGQSYGEYFSPSPHIEGGMAVCPLAAYVIIRAGRWDVSNSMIYSLLDKDTPTLDALSDLAHATRLFRP